jgi:threonine dehydrogenase-like Zn-dependent dehydrogenase
VLAAVTRSPGEMVVEDVSEPVSVRAGNMIVRPEAVGICGSDFHLYSGDLGALSGVAGFYPRVQGHEVSAIVEDPGDGGADAGADGWADGWAVAPGERVAVWPLLACGSCYPCRSGRSNACVSLRLIGVHLDGGLQQRLEVPASALFPVGDLDPDCTAFIEPVSVAVHALARSRLRAGEQVVVIGAGPIGLATVLAAVAAGARVLSIDPVQTRRALAQRLGAEHAIWSAPAEAGPAKAGLAEVGPAEAALAEAGLAEAVRDWTNGEGPPLVVETSGEARVLPQAMEMVSSAGRVVVVGMSSGTAVVRPGAFPEKEIDVIGSSCATAGDFRAAVRLVSAHSASLAALFSHHFPLARAAEAFELAMSRSPDAIKVVVRVDLANAV